MIDARINDFELFQVNSPGVFSRVPNQFYIVPQYLITTILYLAARPNSALGSIPPVNGCIVNLQDNLLWKLRKRTLVTEAKCKEDRIFCTKKEEYPDHCEYPQIHPSVGRYLIIRAENKGISEEFSPLCSRFTGYLRHRWSHNNWPLKSQPSWQIKTQF